MAEAKRPSQEAQDQALAERLIRAETLMHITVEGTGIDFTIPPMENLPISFRRRILRMTGQAFGDLGIDALHQACCLWWASRLLAGEDITLPDAEAEWDELTKGTRLVEIKTEFVTGTDVTDPEQDAEATPEA